MVAIAIMGILASLLLGAAAVASEVARNARSKSLIARLHTLLIERYDGYRNQRIELRSDWATNATIPITGINFAPLSPPQREAAARLVGLREMMKFEMPDRWSDILGMEVPSTPVVISPAALPAPLFLSTSPSLRNTYLRTYNQLVASGATQEQILENESAECLYLIIMNATGDGEARGMFKPNDIGDTDEDGAPEFVDGWGKPISFLRWAPGFDSDAQLSMASLLRQQAKTNGDALVAQAILDDHDPFDLFRLDNPTAAVLRGWRLLPLIVSGGGDEEIGVRTYSGKNYVASLNPYIDLFTNAGYQGLGEATDTPDDFARDIEAELAGDDITNHNVGELSRK
jgi:hypothetical protein